MTDKLSVVARAIAGVVCNDGILEEHEVSDLCREYAKAAIEAHEAALEEQGLVIVPREKGA